MNKTRRNELIKRYVVFLIGLFVNSLGVSLVTKANLGTSPISSIPYVLSLNFAMTLGQFTIFFSLLLIALQLIILGKNFKLEYLLQIPVSIAFGYFIDFCMIILAFIQPEMYVAKLIYLLLGCIILGFGVYLEVLANVIMLPGESFVRAVVFRWKTEFGFTKICFDVTLAVIAVIISFVSAGKLDGVREGTIIAALLVGFIARTIGKKLDFLPEKLFGVSNQAKSEETTTKGERPVVICIGRQYGCGGSAIAKKLADQLNYDFYDREIIQMTAKSTGYSEGFIEKKEEKMTNSLLYDLVTEVYGYSVDNSAPKDSIFEAESKVIEDAAKKNSVIVGRCADWILHENDRCVRVFLTAPVDKRVKNIMAAENISEKEAREKIKLNDKESAQNYRYYTGRIWGQASNYHMSLDTTMGEEYVLETICSAMNKVIK